MLRNYEKLAKQLQLQKNEFYLLPSSDENLLEYVPEYNNRLKWATNFSGSNGLALISSKEKYFFTDGRYILQAKAQLHKTFKIIDSTEIDFFKFIKEKFKKKKIILDFRLYEINFVEKLKRLSIFNSFQIINDTENTVDRIWKDRPVEIKKPFFILEKRISGQDSILKIKTLFNKVKHNVIIITSPDSICWLLNMRGYDLENTPLVFCKVIFSKSELKLFVDTEKVPKNLKLMNKLKILDINNFEIELKKISRKAKILLDSKTSYFYFDFMTSLGLKPEIIEDPCKILKSQKNKIEIKNTRNAHIWDGVSLVKFYTWLDKQKFDSNLDEVNVASKLEKKREENKNFFSNSFPTISAVGSNGSIIHYNPKQNNAKLKPGKLYLCDSGAQYFGATTDVTRTILLGPKKPKKEFILNYTNVLIGNVNLGMCKFPFRTKGYQLDSIARYKLWQNGLDYNHGTGHGVGSFLNVHEGPQSISKKFSNTELKEGMVLSNEPGYYKNNDYGIRIENLILIIKSKFKNFLEFETLTLFPFEIELIDPKLLSFEQKKWINDYHEKVFKKLKNFLNEEERNWLKNKTKTIL